MTGLLEGKPGEKLLVLGNEAIVRGALEGGVGVATTYPGTPSSEIGDTFFKLAKKAGIYFEYSINEKVALEIGIGAAFAGVRTLTFMKHVGLNVAADPFMTYAYIGAPGGHIILSADDPSCHSSQNEQDNRYYALLANIPMLEPSSPQEAKEMVKHGLELSERFQVPVLLRTTTRLNHARGIITLDDRPEPKVNGFFEKDPSRFVNVPAGGRRNHIRLLKLMEEMETVSDMSVFNILEDRRNESNVSPNHYEDSERLDRSKPIGIITSGVSYNYVVEALQRLGIGALVLKLGFTHPLPRERIRELLERVDRVVVVEELEPYLEMQVKALAKDWGLTLPIIGKNQNILPLNNELNDDVVAAGLKKALAIESTTEPSVDVADAEKTLEEARHCALDPSIPLPSRPPTLCPGCGHRAAYYAAKLVGKSESIYCNDIGCYTLAVQYPLRTADTCVCMGASASIPGGFAKVTEQQIFSFVGDSTFFHSGIPGLINAVHNNHNFVYVILDNSTTAMTGHQPHPGIPINGRGEVAPAISIEQIVKACGVEFVEVIDPFDLKATRKIFRQALDHEGIAVVIARHPCYLQELRMKRRAGEPVASYQINQEKCKKCKTCVEKFGCPAFYYEDEDIMISQLQCGGCGVCLQVCPFGAIEVIE